MVDELSLFLGNILDETEKSSIVIFFSGSKSPGAINGEGQEFVPSILNDTTVSDISADITVDSVRDHTM